MFCIFSTWQHWFQKNTHTAYKVKKTTDYWPNTSLNERLNNIISNLNILRNKIASVVSGIENFVPNLEPNDAYTINGLKGYEDLLDALLSAMVGCNYLDKKAVPKPLGDQTGAIWVPKK